MKNGIGFLKEIRKIVDKDHDIYQYVADEDREGMRMDQFLAEELSGCSRSYIGKLCKEGRARINGKGAKAGNRIRCGDEISISVPAAEEPEVFPEEMDLDIVYEDEDLLVVNKPKGMVVHPGAGNPKGTLVNGLLAHCRGHLSGINGVLRPGIVHRIDKDTTGLLLVCKTDRAHRDLALQLKEHTINRVYQAIVRNNLKEESGVIDRPIGRSSSDRKKMAVTPGRGRRAVTHYQVIDHLNKRFNHIECRLETGRTHQIRVHMASVGHPLLGDEVYGPAGKVPGLPATEGQCLHAGLLGFIHPSTGNYMEFSVDPPEYFKRILDILRG